MYKSEKKTIFNVLALYLSSTLLLIATIFTSYYMYQKEQVIDKEKEVLKGYALELEDALLSVFENNTETYTYPRFDNFKSAIYDIDKNLIFSTFDTKIENLDTNFLRVNDKSYGVSLIKPYYLGAAYLVVETKSLPLEISNNVIFIVVVMILITVITSFFLVKLVLKPLRENLHLLDNFIKDTTHELNTPITTILANIETLKTQDLDAKSLKKFQRIKIASLKISNLYQDLVYLLLHHKTSFTNEDLDISLLLKERLQYFTMMAKARELHFKLDIDKDIIFRADKQKYERLVDNILSNAIKYTKNATTIQVILRKDSLSVIDEGKGMKPEEVEKIYEKYRRFDNVQGGFGIGYSIIKSIADEYNINIQIDSQVDRGTKVILRW